MDNEDIAQLAAALSATPFLGGSAPCTDDRLLHRHLPDRLPTAPPALALWCQRMAAQGGAPLPPPPPHANANIGAIINKLNALQLKNQSNSSRTMSTSSEVDYKKLYEQQHIEIENLRKALKEAKTGGNASPVEAESSKAKKGGGKVVLKTPKGTRDYHPHEMVLREQVLSTVAGVFRLHGVGQIDTPVFELRDVLTGKYGEDSKLIYDLEDQGGEMLSLRYDLTVPFARYVAQNKKDSMARYQISKVYRRDNPAMTRGRYREFYQCDLDIAGKDSPMFADSECVQIMHQILSKLQLGTFTIKVNHRKVLDGLFGACGVPQDKFRTICSAVDKLDKSPWDEVRREMVEEKGLEAGVADRIGEYVRLAGKEDLLEKLRADPLVGKNKDVVSGLDDLELLVKHCQEKGCAGSVSLDMSLARGLDYYTGVIYEAVLTEAVGEDGTVGSVAAGGRYDELVGMFAPKGRSVPCVGVSFGIERLFTLVERKAQALEGKNRPSETSVYVMGFGKKMRPHRNAICAMLHEADISAEMSRKENPKTLDEFQYAEKNVIPWIVGVGETEAERGEVKVRNTSTKEETRVPRTALVEHIKQLLSG